MKTHLSRDFLGIKSPPLDPNHPPTYQGKSVQAQTSRQHARKCGFPPYLFRWHFPHSCARPVSAHQYLPGKRSRKEKSEVQRRSEAHIVIEKPNILEKKRLQFVSWYMFSELCTFLDSKILLSMLEREMNWVPGVHTHAGKLLMSGWKLSYCLEGKETSQHK